MRAHTISSRAAQLWYLTVGIRWQRWQEPVARLYYRRVTYPCRMWLACGQPAEFTPRLPWWQYPVLVYLRVVGVLPLGRSRHDRRHRRA